MVERIPRYKIIGGPQPYKKTNLWSNTEKSTTVGSATQTDALLVAEAVKVIVEGQLGTCAAVNTTSVQHTSLEETGSFDSDLTTFGTGFIQKAESKFFRTFCLGKLNTLHLK